MTFVQDIPATRAGILGGGGGNLYTIENTLVGW